MGSTTTCMDAAAQEEYVAFGEEGQTGIGQDELIELTMDAEDVNEAQYERFMEQMYDRQPEHYVLVQANSRMKRNEEYVGDAWHETIRYGYTRQDSTHRTWKAGLVMDKDAGERWRKRMPWADSFSLYAATERNRGWLRQAIVGHYRVRMGSGLMCNQQFALGKNVAGTMFMQNTKAITPHASASEDDYMQGAATRIRMGNHLEMTAFASARQIDGTLRNDTLTAWSTGGYHRTPNELKKRNASWISNAGTTFSVMGEWYRIGANVLYTQLQHTYYRTIRTDNRNAFRGHELLQGSVDYEARLPGLHLKGETAMDDHGGWATIDAMKGHLTTDWTATAMYRRYSNTYRQIIGSSVAESSAMQGETGVTLQAEGPLTRHLSLNLTADWFHFSAPQYGMAQPSDGYELSGKMTYAASATDARLQQVTVTYRLKQKRKNDTLTKDPTDLTAYFRHTINATALWNMGYGLTLKTQARGRMYSAQNTGGLESGWLVSQQATWQHRRKPLRMDAQVTYFRTDNYETRVYLSEHNPLYVFNMPMLYGKGQRYTFALSYKPARRFSAEAKYAHTTTRGNEVWVGIKLRMENGKWKSEN